MVKIADFKVRKYGTLFTPQNFAWRDEDRQLYPGSLIRNVLEPYIEQSECESLNSVRIFSFNILCKG